MNLKKQFWPYLVLMTGFMAAMSLVSCSEKEYDFSNGIDTTIDINADVSLPIGSSEFIVIGDFLQLDEADGNIITKDEQGNYLITFTGDSPVRTSVDLPDVTFEPQVMEHVEVGFSGFSLYLIGKDPHSIQIPEGVATSYNFKLESVDLLTNVSGDPTMDVMIDSELPSEVVDIFWADVNSAIKFYFELDNGKIALDNNIEIAFPEFMTIEKPASASGYSVEKNIVRLTDGLEISQGKPAFIELLVSKIDLTYLENHGIEVVDGVRRLVIDDYVTISGTATVDAYDFNPVPDRVKMTMYVELEAITVDRAKAKLDISETLDSREVTFDGVPGFLTGNDIYLDFWNPVVWLGIDNSSDLTAQLNADFISYTADNENSRVHIGADGPEGNRTEPFVLAPGYMKYYLSKLGSCAQNQDETDIIVPSLGEFFAVIPDRVEICNAIVATDPDEEVIIDLGQGSIYSYSLEYGINCPLAFGRDLNLSYVLELEDMNSIFNSSEDNDFTIDIRQAEITFTMKNTIPMNIDLDVLPVDLEGNVILSGINIMIEGNIPAATPDSPVEEPVRIAITADSETIKKLDGLKLTIKAKGSSVDGIEGVPFNENQGIQLLDIKARVAGSVSASLLDNDEDENDKEII